MEDIGNVVKPRFVMRPFRHNVFVGVYFVGKDEGSRFLLFFFLGG